VDRGHRARKGWGRVDRGHRAGRTETGGALDRGARAESRTHLHTQLTLFCAALQCALQTTSHTQSHIRLHSYTSHSRCTTCKLHLAADLTYQPHHVALFNRAQLHHVACGVGFDEVLHCLTICCSRASGLTMLLVSLSR